jgi:hypothetical protein
MVQIRRFKAFFAPLIMVDVQVELAFSAEDFSTFGTPALPNYTASGIR